ncbi:hypothetical protein D1647_01970 [Alistipes sp. Z76]|nr:hypothetical protein [Alistipes sp. Z76]NCE66979.1 hypothetical protein [Muribaculaceae bacterium M3]
MRNKLLANYLTNSGNELATIRISAFYVACCQITLSDYKKVKLFEQAINYMLLFMPTLHFPHFKKKQAI